jgi:hypothetical protein
VGGAVRELSEKKGGVEELKGEGKEEGGGGGCREGSEVRGDTKSG